MPWTIELIEDVMSLPLETLEWHDLPLKSFAITENGLVFHITPFSQTIQDYEHYIFHLSEIASFSLDIRGLYSARNLSQDMEVHSFDYTILPNGRINGKIGILPGSGWWGIEFEDAAWTLTPVDKDQRE